MSGRRRTRTLRSMGPRPATLRAREAVRTTEREAEPLFDWALKNGHWGEGPEEKRPRTRGECEDGPRPCPWVSCRHHLYLDVKESGHLRMNFPGKEVDELEHTCSLDVVDGEELTLEVVGDRVNLTRERVRIIQDEAYERLETMLKGGDYDDE